MESRGELGTIARARKLWSQWGWLVATITAGLAAVLIVHILSGLASVLTSPGEAEMVAAVRSFLTDDFEIIDVERSPFDPFTPSFGMDLPWVGDGDPGDLFDQERLVDALAIQDGWVDEEGWLGLHKDRLVLYTGTSGGDPDYPGGYVSVLLESLGRPVHPLERSLYWAPLLVAVGLAPRRVRRTSSGPTQPNTIRR